MLTRIQWYCAYWRRMNEKALYCTLLYWKSFFFLEDANNSGANGISFCIYLIMGTLKPLLYNVLSQAYLLILLSVSLIWGNFSLNVSFMSFFRSDGFTYSITVVWKWQTRVCLINIIQILWHLSDIQLLSMDSLVYSVYADHYYIVPSINTGPSLIINHTCYTWVICF